MITIPDLQTALLELLYEMQDPQVKPIIGGGLGIYLKVVHIRRIGVRTLLQEWPEPRSTNDIDLFLRPELLIDPMQLKPLAGALDKLGYQPVRGAEKYQFVKPGPGGIEAGSIKIDILTGPQKRFKGTKVRVDDRRARPRPSVGIHAHPVDEAPTLEKGLLPISLSGKLGSGESWQAEVFLPHPFTFLMMKMFAFRDRLDDTDKEFGRYHALDMYAILATTMESEWDQAVQFRDQYADEPYVMEAGDIVSRYFSALDSLGIIRLKESHYWRPELQLEEFISALQELFPAKASTNV